MGYGFTIYIEKSGWTKAVTGVSQEYEKRYAGKEDVRNVGANTTTTELTDSVVQSDEERSASRGRELFSSINYRGINSCLS